MPVVVWKQNRKRLKVLVVNKSGAGCQVVVKNKFVGCASFPVLPSLKRENIYFMETQMEIPVLQKSKVTTEKKAQAEASSCCTPKNNASVCCTLTEKAEDNDGACCKQPEDGSSCCDK